MPSSATVGFFSRSEKYPFLSFHQIPSYKRKEIRKEWLHHIKRGQNEKYLPKNSALNICLEHFEKDCFERDLQISFINFSNISVKIFIEGSPVNNFFKVFVFFWTFFENFKEKVYGEILF